MIHTYYLVWGYEIQHNAGLEWGTREADDIQIQCAIHTVLGSNLYWMRFSDISQSLCSDEILLLLPPHVIILHFIGKGQTFS